MRLSGTKATAIHQYRGLGNQLWDLAGNRPSLDLRFADDKSLVDATTGSNLVDFTRASSGTYVGSDGLIKTAVTNLLLQSEDFSTTWSAARVSVSTDSIAAPNGTVTADTVTGDGTADFPQGVSQSSAVFSTAGTKTFSVYAKAGTNSFLQLYTGGNVNIFANFDLTTGTVGSVGTQSTAAIIPAGNGWYRCVLSTSQTNPTNVAVILVNSSTAVRAEVAGTSNSIYLWGAQLEQSSTVGEYIPTTSTINSAPRFDHDPETGESLWLLVEESRTNLYPYSEDFSQSDWFAGRVTVTTDAITAPDGTLTADALTETTSTGEHYVNDVISVTNGQAYTVSWFAKANGRNHVYCKVFASFPTSSGTIDLETGTFTATSGTGITNTSWQDYGNGWYRVSFTATANATGTASILVGMAQGATTNSYTGDTSLGIYLWGAQLEEGSFPTSYIPTEGSAVTRAADVASITGTNFSSWYRQDEGTVFYEGQVLGSDQLSNKDMLGLSDGTSNEFAKMFIPSGNNQRFRVDVGGVTQVLQNAILPADVYSPVKAAFALKQNNTTCAGNGIVQPEVTSCLIPAVDRFVFGALSTGESELAARYKRITYWPQRLPNEVLQTITQ